MKTNKTQLCNAFAEVESLDYKIISVIVASPLESVDGIWDGFPPIIVNHNLSQWKDVEIILVGQRSTGAVAIEFNCNDRGKLNCLLTKKDRHRLSRVSFCQAMKRVEKQHPYGCQK